MRLAVFFEGLHYIVLKTAATPTALREWCSLWRREHVLLAASFVIFAVILVSRSPSYFFHTAFFAEDGKIWFQDAYNKGGLHSLFLPNVGYLSVAERFSAALALLFPYRWAPLTMVLFGAACQFLPVAILISRRSQSLGPLSLRIAMAAVYAVMPNAHEVYLVATNCMWHLIVAALLVLISEETRLLDIIVVAVSSLSGPFSILLWPFAWFIWWRNRSKWPLALTITLGAAVQLYSVAHQPPRVKVPLAASIHTFIRMTGGQLVTASLLGTGFWGDSRHFVLLLLATLCGVAVLGICFMRSNFAWRIMIAYALVLLASSLYSPLYPAKFTNLPPWLWIQHNGAQRYWYLPSLIFLWACLWCIKARSLPGIILLLMPVGAVRDWKLPPMYNTAFLRSVPELKHAAPGQIVQVQLTPSDWYLTLIKH